MKKLSLGDLMSYWGIDSVAKNEKYGLPPITQKYIARKGILASGGDTPLDATHNLVSALRS